MAKKTKKSKRKSKSPEYFLGGLMKKALPVAAGMIPGAGAFLGPAVGMGISAMEGATQGGTPEQTQYSSASQGSTRMANGGPMDFMGQNAFAFTGPSHEGGGIPFNGAEVEGGETMDFIEFRGGGKMMDSRDGSPYIFSKRLKVPETNTSFADTHKKLVKDNASEDEIKQLAMMQEKLTGRDQMKDGGKMNYQTGGAMGPDPTNPFQNNYIRPNFAIKGKDDVEALVEGMNPALANPIPNIPRSKSNEYIRPGFAQKGKDDVEALIEGMNPAVMASKNNKTPWSMMDSVDQTPAPTADSFTPGIASTPRAPQTPTQATNPIPTASVSAENVSPDIPQGSLDAAQTPEMMNPEVPIEAGEGSGEGGMEMGSALQYIPEIMNFATGIFGKNKTPKPTQVSNRAVDMVDTNVNVNPQLMKNAQGYRAILSDPNATVGQKLAAQSMKQQGDSQVFADKWNRENQLKSNQARIQANLDSQNAQFANQARSENMMGDAMFGPTGNMARQAAGSFSQKLLQNQAQNNQKKQDKIAAMSVISQLDPALQEKFINQLGLLQ